MPHNYPYKAKFKDSLNVVIEVLFTAPHTGKVIYSSNSDHPEYRIGYHSSDWVESSFITDKGSFKLPSKVDVIDFTNRLDYHHQQLKVLTGHLLNHAKYIVPYTELDDPTDNIRELMRTDNSLEDLRNTLATYTSIIDEIEADINNTSGRKKPIE